MRERSGHAARRAARTAVDLAVRGPDRRVGRRQVAGDPRARGPRLLLRRQPAGHAAADARRADAAGGQRDRARRGRRGRARRQAARPSSRAIFRKLQAMRDLDPVLIFLEASDAALVRRFSETRRPHPLAPDRSAHRRHPRGARARCSRIRRLADHIVDTSGMTVHELRHAFTERRQAGARPGSQLVVTILSFGFKHGIPVDSDLLFDVRFLPNPHFVPSCARTPAATARCVRYLDESRRDARVPRAHAQPAALPDPAIRRAKARPT